jgi:hypothetical protein
VPALQVLQFDKLLNGVSAVAFDIGRAAAFDRDDAAVEAREPVDLTRYGLLDQNLLMRLADGGKRCAERFQVAESDMNLSALPVADGLYADAA